MRTRVQGASPLPLAVVVTLLAGAASGQATDQPIDEPRLVDFATRYAEAWSSQDPEQLASFYTEGGSLSVNGGEPAVGRAEIAAKAKGFMEAFPDMLVVVDAVEPRDGGAVFRWIWTGTNTGPGGTGREVDMTGFEEWTFGEGGLIAESRGSYDEAEYLRQVEGETRGE